MASEDSGSRSPPREKKHKKERRERRDRRRSRSGDRDSRRDRDSKRERRSRRSRSRKRERSRDRRSRSGGRGSRRDRESRRSRTPQRSGRMYKDLSGREFRDQRSRQYPSRSRSFGKVRNQRKKEDDDEEPSASLMIQQMLAQKTNPMLVSMMGPTAASMGPGMGLGNVFDQPASAPVDSGAADAGPLSKVLMLENAVEEEDLKDDQEYNDLMEDMKEEAEKHGTVLKVTIPRPVEGQQVQGVGKVFIVFDFDAGASRAQASLNGRKFGDSVVKCTFMDEAKFNALEY